MATAQQHIREMMRERGEKGRAQIWGPDRWIDKKQEKVERDLTEERGLNGEEMMRVRELEEDRGGKQSMVKAKDKIEDMSETEAKGLYYKT